MKKLAFTTLLCLSVASSALANENLNKSNSNTKTIETNIVPATDDLRLLYKCIITVKVTQPDGTLITTIYSYTLESGTRSAAEEWCENKKQQFY